VWPCGGEGRRVGLFEFRIRRAPLEISRNPCGFSLKTRFFPFFQNRGPSHQSTCLNIQTRMDRSKCVVRGVRGVAPCQLSFCMIMFQHVRNPLRQSIRICRSVLVRYWPGEGEATDGKNKTSTHTTTSGTIFFCLSFFFFPLFSWVSNTQLNHWTM
jgi:hypothetical protein